MNANDKLPRDKNGNLLTKGDYVHDEHNFVRRITNINDPWGLNLWSVVVESQNTKYKFVEIYSGNDVAKLSKLTDAEVMILLLEQ